MKQAKKWGNDREENICPIVGQSGQTSLTFIWQLSWQISRQTADIVNVWRTFHGNAKWEKKERQEKSGREKGEKGKCMERKGQLIMLLPTPGLLPFPCASYFKAVNTFQSEHNKKIKKVSMYLQQVLRSRNYDKSMAAIN